MNAELAAVADVALDVWLGAHPLLGTRLGFHQYDELVPDLTEEGEAAQRDAYVDLLARTRAIDPKTCDAQEQLTRAIIETRLTDEIESIDHRGAELDVGVAFAGVPALVLHAATKLELQTPEQADAFRRRGEGFADVIAASVERLRRGVTAGRTPPARAVQASMAELDTYLALPLTDDPLLAVTTPEGWRDVDAWRASTARVVERTVRPALEAYRRMIEEEVLPAARPDDRSGLCWLAEGDGLYRAAVRRHTTTSLTADDIHDRGLAVIAQLHEAYEALGAKVLGTGDRVETIARLRHDRSLRYADASSIVAMAEAALARAREAEPAWFGRRPDAELVVREIPPLEAPTAPRAYYHEPALDGTRPATYWANTADPGSISIYDAEAVAFHEGTPGHHLQVGLALTIGELPLFRRLSFFTAYVEGWALYAERLADEMDLYSDDLQRLGAVVTESMRACRLVVDTGIHHRGWSRQRAIDFVVEHSAWALDDVPKEIDRYIAMPGQALGYLVGSLEILRVRDDARRHLGPAFDIRGFHDTVLGCGSVPLAVLEELVNNWAKQKASK